MVTKVLLTFRGVEDLNNPPAASGVTLPGQNGALSANSTLQPLIVAGWCKRETSAIQGDRIIYDGDDNNWILIAGRANVLTLVLLLVSRRITASEDDVDAVTPVISIVEARTSTAAGAIAGDVSMSSVLTVLFTDGEQADVVHTSGITAGPRAVVTADLLKVTISTFSIQATTLVVL